MKRDLEFRDSKALEKWLKTRPREVAVIIAARAALRALPVAARELPAKDVERLCALISALFRASALVRVAAKYPTRGGRFPFNFAFPAATAVRIANTSPNAAADAFHTAALALTYVYNAYVVKYASVAVDQAGHFEDADNWRALSKDASFLSAGGAVAELADRPLWPDAVPPLAAEIWARLKAGLPTGEDWDVWIRWYDERLRCTS